MKRFSQENLFLLIFALVVVPAAAHVLKKRSYADQSIRMYSSERTCWQNEICKEEFKNIFRCRCPAWSYCRSPGRYYSAYCSITNTGYIWTQPSTAWDWAEK